MAEAFLSNGIRAERVSPEHRSLKMLYAEPFHAPPILISFAIPSFDALHEREVGPQKHPNTKPSHPPPVRLHEDFPCK